MTEGNARGYRKPTVASGPPARASDARGEGRGA